MTPTIEEVKRVAEGCGAHEYHSKNESAAPLYRFWPNELQAFAQHYIEVGRKMQREKDIEFLSADLKVLQDTEAAHYRLSPHPFKPEEFGFNMMHLSKLQCLVDAIRNNTGE